MSELTKIDTATEVEVQPADPMISMIERVATDPNSDLAKLERMLELKERHDAQNAKAEFAAAFARASANFPTIPLNGRGHNGKPYATLEDITKKTRPVLSEHGLALTFAIEVGQDVVVTAKLMHKAGHAETTSIALPRDTSGSKNAVQAVGSTQTYGQRYTAQAILGLSLGMDTEDDGRQTGGTVERQAPSVKSNDWATTVTQDLPPNATHREKAEAIADALCAQWKRKTTFRQLSNEWDRRANLIDGEKGLQGKHADLWEKVVDAYEEQAEKLRLAERETMPEVN